VIRVFRFATATMVVCWCTVLPDALPQAFLRPSQQWGCGRRAATASRCLVALTPLNVAIMVPTTLHGFRRRTGFLLKPFLSEGPLGRSISLIVASALPRSNLLIMY